MMRANSKKEVQDVLSQRGCQKVSLQWYLREKLPGRKARKGQAGVPCTFCISNLHTPPLPWG